MLNVGVERLKGKRGSVCMICKSVCVRKWKKTGGGKDGREVRKGLAACTHSEAIVCTLLK